MIEPLVRDTCNTLSSYSGLTTGQCILSRTGAGSRTFVHESIYDQFLDAVVAVARNKPLLCDDPENPEGLQPVIDERQRERILNYIEIGKKEGARLLFGGEAPRNKAGYYVQPTIFADVQDHHTIAREEIFGPVMSILKYSTVEEVIRSANDTIYVS